MSPQALHPEPLRLRQLLTGALDPDEQAELTRHLDSCDHCQRALEDLAGGDAWSGPVRQLGRDRPASNSAYWVALKDLHSGVTEASDPTPPPPVADDVPLDFLAPSEQPGHLGRLEEFEIVSLLGRGGMGIVLKAFDTCLQRTVAIKVLAPHLANNATARQRFCREARAAAGIRHENVIAIHAVDETTDGTPYLVMEYVPGVALDEHLARTGPLPLEEIVRIGRQTASGLAAAHAHGLIHRDIKPANILLETGVDRVKITDFGLARADEDVRLTQSGVVAGTPQYMAPEQAEGKPLDARADLFSLGSVLYACCTGKAPFEASSALGMLLAITRTQPRPIKEINPKVPDWLVQMIDTLHAKDPADRFRSAAEVADLLGEYQAHLAQPSKVALPCLLSRRAHRARRRRLLVAGALAVVLLLGLVTTEATGVTRVTVSLAALLDGRHEQRIIPPRLTLPGNAGPVWSVAFSPDGHTLAMAQDSGTVKLWDPATGAVKTTIHAHKKFPVWSVAFSFKGRYMATGSDEGNAKIWDTATWSEARALKNIGSVRPLAFSAQSPKLVIGSRDGSVRIWDCVRRHPDPVVTEGHEGVVMAVAFSGDGKMVASASGDGTVKLWNAETGREQVSLQGNGGGVYGLAISPDGKKVAAGGWDHDIRVWDTASGNLLATFKGHSQDVWSVAFAPDGQTLASGSGDRTVKLWDVDTGRELVTFAGHGGTVYCVAFSPDGQTVASGSRDGSVKLWDVSAR